MKELNQNLQFFTKTDEFRRRVDSNKRYRIFCKLITYNENCENVTKNNSQTDEI